MTTPAQSIWIIAGEASGDDYGACLAESLRARRPGLQIRGMGGGKMAAAGVELLIDSSELGVVGIFEALRHLPVFIRLLRQLVAHAAAERPQAVVLIDYPGFNLRLAARLHALGLRVVYYISPQVWAWKRGRIQKMAACVDELLCIFPFEPEVYAGSGLPVTFVGHPLLQILAPYQEPERVRDERLVLLLPGSRRQELQRLLPVFLRTAVLLHQHDPQLRFIVPLPRQRILDYALELKQTLNLPDTFPPIEFSLGNTRALMGRAAAGLAASGTVTVEAAILGLPLVVSYKLHWLSWQIAQLLVKLPSITIANLVCQEKVYEEYLQGQATPENLSQAVRAILPGGQRREAVLAGVARTVRLLGGNEDVSGRVADKVLGWAER